MKTIREAINAGARSIYLNSGVLIVHCDHGLTYDAMCPPKFINGKPVYRWLFCRITNFGGINHLDFLKAKDKYHDPLQYDFILSERDMNEFISLEGGIDEYRTMYWVRDWSLDLSFEETLDRLIDALERI